MNSHEPDFANEAWQKVLTAKFVGLGAFNYSAIPRYGARRSKLADGNRNSNSQACIKAVVPYEVAECIMDYLQTVSRDHRVTACLETVEVLKRDGF
jgi:hypothetical protein